VRALRGRMTLRPFGVGTKSERDALILETAEGDLLIRRRTGPSFGRTGLEHLVGEEVACDGTIAGDVLLADAVRVVGSRR